MKYYLLESSHWNDQLEFKSELDLSKGQCFRIKKHNSSRLYPTRFKVLEVSDTPKYSGTLVEIFEVNTDVESF
jgi:hypothetical protein